MGSGVPALFGGLYQAGNQFARTDNVGLLTMSLKTPHPKLLASGQEVGLVADAQRAADDRAGDDCPEPLGGEYPVDEQPEDLAGGTVLQARVFKDPCASMLPVCSSPSRRSSRRSRSRRGLPIGQPDGG